MAHSARDRLARAAVAAGPLWCLAVESVIWAVLMTASAVLSLTLEGWQDRFGIAVVALLFFVSALVAYSPSVLAACLLSERRGLETRFAAHFLMLAAGTVATAAVLNGLWLRSYFAAWHAAPFSIEWTFQFVFTVAGGAYQFALFGMRLYLPLGFAALLAFALWRTARMR
jgi:hypothetical protein